MKNYTGLEIAVIGLSGRFPGAGNVSELWENLINGKESISFFSKDDLIKNGLDPQTASHKNYVGARGILDAVGYFDNGLFGFTPKEATLLDPQVRVFFECVYESLEDAAYDSFNYDGKIGLFAGANPNLYWGLASRLSGVEDIGDFANKDLLSTRISYKLNLKGPSCTFYTACSTSLVAIHQACRSLLGGECDMAIAGGVSIELPQINGYLYQEGLILSKDGHNRSFDEKASGTVFGNGAAAVILKPLEAAIDDRDHIYAVIKGSAINNDGNRKVSFPAPSVKGQVEVIQEALQVAGVEADSITYVEAHGSGTSIGDPIEVDALVQAFNLSSKQTCGIGSVKTNVGHLNIASGVTGFIKTVLALGHKVIPANLHYTSPNPQIAFGEGPFYVIDKNTPWLAKNGIRRAGISSFGVGGTNAHVIVEDAPERIVATQKNRPNILVFSAKTPFSMEKMKGRMIDFLKGTNCLIDDIAFTLQVGRHTFDTRCFYVCNNKEDAIAKFSSTDEITSAFKPNETKTVVAINFTFSGTNQCDFGTISQLYDQVPFFKHAVDEGLNALKNLWGDGIEKEILQIFSLPISVAGNQFQNLSCKKSLFFIFQHALSELLKDINVRPVAVTGYEAGNYAAMCATELLDFHEIMKIVVAHDRLLTTTDDAQNSFMLHQEFKRLLWAANFKKTKVAYFSPVTGRPIADNEAKDPGYWEKMLTPGNGYDRAAAMNIRDHLQIEIKIDGNLPPLPKGSNNNAPNNILQLLCANEEKNGEYCLLETLGNLWVKGVAINWARYYASDQRARVSAPTYCFDRKLFWFDEQQFRKKTAVLTGPSENANGLSHLYKYNWVSQANTHQKKVKQHSSCIFFYGQGAIADKLIDEISETYLMPVIRVKACSHTLKTSENTYDLNVSDLSAADAFIDSLSLRTSSDIDIVFCGFWEELHHNKSATADTPAELFGTNKSYNNLIKCFSVRYNRAPVNIYIITQEFYANKLNAFLYGGNNVLTQIYTNVSFKLINTDAAYTQLAPVRLKKLIRLIANELYAMDNSAICLKDNERYVVQAVETKVDDSLAKGTLIQNEQLVIFGKNGSMLNFVVDSLKDQNIINILTLEAAVTGFPVVSLQNALQVVKHAPITPSNESATLFNFGDTALELELALICHYFENIGIGLYDGAQFNWQLITDGLGYSTRYHKFFNYFIQVLAKWGAIFIDGNHVVVTKKIADVRPLSQIQARIFQEYPQATSLYNLLKHCVDHYPQVFSGQIPGIGVLFPDGKSELLDSLSGDNAIISSSSFYIAQAARAVLHYLDNCQPGQQVKILEAGAGRGELTKAMLPLLRNYNVKYCFTDIGKTFLREGEKRFGPEYNFIDFAVFDVNQDPVTQGFETHSFDIILAFDVVHATPSLQKTLLNLQKTLIPGGWMLLVENVASLGLANLVWGLTDGWWDFTDHDLRKNSPLISRKEWLGFLSSMDFAFVDTMQGYEIPANHDHTLIALQTRADRLDPASIEILPENDERTTDEQIGNVTSSSVKYHSNARDIFSEWKQSGKKIDRIIYLFDGNKQSIADLWLLKDLAISYQLKQCAVLSSSFPCNADDLSLTSSVASAVLTEFITELNDLTDTQWLSLKWPGFMQSPNKQDAGMQLIGSLLNADISGEWLLADIPPTPPQTIRNNNRETDVLPPLPCETSVARTQSTIIDKLCIIWKDVFDIEGISMDDDYFELGGDSLMMVAVLSKIEKAFSIKISISEFYDNLTIFKLAKLIENKEVSHLLKVPVAEKKTHYPTTSAQKTMFYMQMLHPESTAYNITKIIELFDHVDEQRIASCVNTIVCNHSSLRTAFRIIKGEPAQIVFEQFVLKPEYFVLDMDSVTGVIGSFVKPFDLSDRPPVKLAFFTGPNSRYMAIGIHHIICDGVSIDVIKNELNDLYFGYDYPQVKMQYHDFAEWQSKKAFKAHLKKQEAFWMNIFKEPVKGDVVPYDFLKNDFERHTGGHIIETLDESFSGEIIKLTKATNSTLFSHLLASAFILLSKYTGDPDIVIGTGAKGRNFQGLDYIIGNFVNTIALRCFPRGYISYRKFHKEVERVINEGLENQDYQYEELIAKLPYNLGKKDKSLFNVTLTLLSESLVNQNEPAERKLFKDYVEYFNNTAKFNININAVEKAGTITLVVEYSTSLYKKGTIRNFLDNYLSIIKTVTSNSGVKIAEVPFHTIETQQEHTFQESSK